MGDDDTLSPSALPPEMDLDGEIHLVSHVNEVQSQSGFPTNPRRKEISKEQWETLKPLIRRLYLDESMTRKAVTKHIVKECDFAPTKRQFNRKISEWGLEKNTKKAERLSVIASVKRQNVFETTTIRGRKLDQAKIERWSKQSGVMLQSQQVNSEVVDETSISAVKITDDNGSSNSGSSWAAGWISTETDATNMDVDPANGHMTADGNRTSFNWELVDIIGSPRLTGLLGALSLFECEPFSLDSPTSGLDVEAALEELEMSPELDLQHEDVDPSISTAIARSNVFARKQNSAVIPLWTSQNGPSIGLSPFPKPAANAKASSYEYSISGRLPRFSEDDCMAKMRRWSKMKPVDIIDLADSMLLIGNRYCNLYDYHMALPWYRRIIRLKKHERFRHLNPGQTLIACLSVIICLLKQGNLAELRNLHQHVQETILALFPDSDILISSRETQAFLHGSFGEVLEEEAIFRELLQIRLSKFGITSRQGVVTLRMLADCLLRRNFHSQSEKLIRIIQHLGPQVPGYCLSGVTDRMDAFERQVDLVIISNETDRLLEAENLLQQINKVFPDLIAIEDRRSILYNFELARLLRFQGRILESEKILQDLLHHQEALLVPYHRAVIMRELATIAEQTGRWSEAKFWNKKTYVLYVEIYGLEHKYSMGSCWYLGRCYVKEGLFDEAVSHFEHAISKIGLLYEDGDDAPNENVEEIRGWLVHVDTESCKAIGFRNADQGQFDEALLHFQQHNEKLVEVQMDSGSGPVYDSATHGIERIKRCISIVKMDQCKAVGFDLAGKGLFEKAISHFQRIEAELIASERNGKEIVPGSNTQSLERVRRWITTMVHQEMENCEKIGFDLVEHEQFDEAIVHFQQAITRVTNAETVEPSTDAYRGCVEKIQRWMSTAYAQKFLGSCWEVGMGFADEGFYDKALQHFQEAIDGIDPRQENGTHEPGECIEILQAWMQRVEERKAQ
ncbi:hypothetical protein BKA64DRAFT_700222 [Cadophora sp. MPI-SDFR-AT-0126]|nr:hypothetical protein BKA64DRAFT_700222 [Leotiomycetes sp. MPI-SDFR-AT-0126]